MKLLDGLLKIGQFRILRPLASFILSYIARLPFYLLLMIAGRRLVTASAASPAILLSGSSLEEATKNAELLYKAMKYTIESMHLDTFCLMADLSIEAEACGCTVVYEKGKVPSIQTHIVDKLEDIEKLKLPDPYHDGRMPVFLQTMRLLKRNLVGLKLACVTGPFTLALNLRGSNIYIDTIRNKSMVQKLMDFTTEVTIKYSKAFVESGADMIIIAEPACSQLSPEYFDVFALTYIRKVIGSINRNCIFHVCGNTNHIIHQICSSGASAINVDEVNLQELIKQAPSNLVISGNINPTKIAMGSQDEILKITRELNESIKVVKNFVITPGCDLSPQTPLENIQAFVEAVKPSYK